MHDIDMTNDQANMAYIAANGTPWHGLGQTLDLGASIEHWAIQAGMDHTIERSRVVYRWGNETGQVTAMDDKIVLWRSDNHEPLAVVSARYKVVQPREVLEFFRDLVGTTGDYELETAGVLDGGKKYWALAKYKDEIDFGSGDKVKPYLLLATSADGSLATTGQLTSVRVVCWNTLSMSVNGQDKAGSIKVRHSTTFDPYALQARLGVDSVIAAYKTNVETLINKAISRDDSVEILVNLVAKRDDKENISNEKHVKRVVAEIMQSLATAPGADFETASGTAWGLVNAVTHYIDFKARARDNNNRFTSAQFGPGANMKAQAVKLALAA